MKKPGWRSAWRLRAFTLKLLSLASFTCLSNSATVVNAQQQTPELLIYNELVQLYEQESPPDALQNKLRRLLTIPFVSNVAAARGVKPLLPTTSRLGKSLRVVEWNIERGLEYDAVRMAFTDATGFAKLLDSSAYG